MLTLLNTQKKSKRSIEHNEISGALAASVHCFLMQDGNLKLRLTGERYEISAVCNIEKLVKELILSTDVIFKKERRPLSGRLKIKNGNIGQLFISYLKLRQDEISHSFPHHEFSPSLKLFFEAKINHQEQYDKYSGLNNFDSFEPYAKSLNECVAKIRKDGKSKTFTKKSQDYHRLPNKNFLALNKYIDNLFIKFQRLLVLRIDFGYVKGVDFLSTNPPDVQHIDVNSHRLQLVRYFKEKLPTKSIVGFAWKLHHSLINSYQYSFILFSRLDVKGGDDSELITKLIGEQWSNVITNGEGFYYSGEKFQGGYKRFGVGIAYFHDTVKRAELVKAAIYLAKKDYYMQLLIPENCRSFGKGGPV